MPVASRYVSCFNELIYSNSYSVKQEEVSCHFLTLYAFVIFTFLNGACVLMLFNECIS